MAPGKSDPGHDRPGESSLRPTKQPRMDELALKVEATLAEFDKIWPPYNCRICMTEGLHPTIACKMLYGCSSDDKVGPEAELICLCCEEDATTAHPDEPCVPARARLKSQVYDKRVTEIIEAIEAKFGKSQA